MKNNIKKALVKFQEGLLYFQHFIQTLFLLQISDYHHLKYIHSVSPQRVSRSRAVS